MKIFAVLLIAAVGMGQDAPKFSDIGTFTITPAPPPTLTMRGDNGTEFVLKAEHIFAPDGPHAATLSFNQPGSGRIDRLSDDEYARLVKLRQALAEAEKEIAKAHDVKLERGCDGGYDMGHCLGTWIAPDRYEYRGQFLLINVPTEEEK